jgi:hypothetical protein
MVKKNREGTFNTLGDRNVKERGEVGRAGEKFIKGASEI